MTLEIQANYARLLKENADMKEQLRLVHEQLTNEGLKHADEVYEMRQQLAYSERARGNLN